MALEHLALAGFIGAVLLPSSVVGGTLGFQLLPAAFVVLLAMFWQSPWPY